MHRRYVEKKLEEARIEYERVMPTGFVKLKDGSKMYWRKLIKGAPVVEEEPKKKTRKKKAKEEKPKTNDVQIWEVNIEDD